MATEMDWRGHDESLGGVLSDFFESPEVRAKMGAGHAAGLAWHSVIGDIERKHTTGVFVGKPKVPGMAPALCVYVDSRMRMVDFNANREIYLARLQTAGFDYSEVRFLQNKRPRPKAEQTSGQPMLRDGREGAALPSRTAEKVDKGTVPLATSEPLPELSEAERAQIEAQTAGLSPALRESVSKAMAACMRRQRYEGRKNL